jgi:hypothetical protein
METSNLKTKAPKEKLFLLNAVFPYFSAIFWYLSWEIGKIFSEH